MLTTLRVAALSAALALSAAPAMAQSANPWRDGESWTVTGISIKDGGDLQYADYLAMAWTRQHDFAKSKGWIKGYHVLRNVNPRAGEPDVYLIVVGGSLPDGATMDARGAEMRAHMAMTEAQISAAARHRAEDRTVMNNILLREQVRR
jgi:hypothetical protein